MEVKMQLNGYDWTQLYDTAKLLDMAIDDMTIMNQGRGMDQMDLEELLYLCSRTARRIIEMVQGMERVPDPKPASGCNGSTTGEGSGEDS